MCRVKGAKAVNICRAEPSRAEQSQAAQRQAGSGQAAFRSLYHTMREGNLKLHVIAFRSISTNILVVNQETVFGNLGLLRVRILKKSDWLFVS